MNTQHLTTYLSDHIALSVAGVELAKRCRSSNEDSELGTYLGELIPKLEYEQKIVKSLLHKLEASESLLKNMAGWAAEKVGRFKPNDSILRYSPLSRVVELETLISGLRAQMLMWKTLELCSEEEPAISDIKCAWFAAEHITCGERLEEFHKEAVQQAFMEGKSQ